MKAKSILFKVKLKGSGVVNYDDYSQRFMFNKTKEGQKFMSHDNVKLAKKEFFYIGEELNYRLKISSACLSKAIFENEHPFQNPNVKLYDNVYLPYLADPTTIFKGYMFAGEKEEVSDKRKSSYTITDVVQTSSNISFIDTCSRSGGKSSDETKSDTSFFYVENIGETEYSAKGVIDLEQLQFISLDQLNDRMAFHPDKFPVYSKFLKQNFGKEYSAKYYTGVQNINKIPEYGILLDNTAILKMVNIFFTNLINAKIRRKNAFVEVVDVEYKIVENPLTDSFSSEEGWSSFKMNDKLDFESQIFYVEEDFEKSEKMKQEIAEQLGLNKKKRKESVKKS